MAFKSIIRKSLIQLTGYWIYKQKHLPIGCDLASDLLLKLKLPIQTIFDVGANIGQSTKNFISDYQGAKIYAFEPFQAAYSILHTTYNSSQVKCFKLALGDTTETKEIVPFEGDLSVLNSLSEFAANTSTGTPEKIDVTRGDTFCKQNNIHLIDLLKIDTEGYEIEVLKGFEEAIANGKIKAILCEVGFNKTNLRNTHINDLLDYFNSLSYHFYGMYDIENQQIKDSHNFGNVLFVHHSVLS